MIAARIRNSSPAPSSNALSSDTSSPYRAAYNVANIAANAMPRARLRSTWLR